MTAQNAGNKGVDVLSTPALVQLIEDAAMQCLAPALGGGQVSVSAYVDLSHIAPTPVGLILRTEVEIISIDGPRVNFAVAAFDEKEKVAEGTHERYLIEKTALRATVEEKLLA